MQKIELLNTPKEWGYFGVTLGAILCVSIFLSYLDFRDLTAYKYKTLENVTVLNQYTKINKKNKPYTVLKLRHKSYSFYTTAKADIPLLLNQQITLTIISDKLTFSDFFIPPFYLSSFNIKAEPSLYHQSVTFFQSQHKEPFLSEIFSSLFLASHIGYENRQILSSLGISHLVAISGYHLGLLSFLLYFVLSPIYQFFQNRFFPYRNRLYDLSLVVFVIVCVYAYAIGSPISLVRSLFMMAFGIFLLLRHIYLLSFHSLGIIVCFILAINPHFVTSISFWLSVGGVFYIYLFLHYFKDINKIFLFLTLNIWLFLTMNIVSHFIFEQTSWWQILSPIFSIVFNVFYPLELFLHTFSWGGLLDSWLITGWEIVRQSPIWKVSVSLPFLIAYILLSLGATWHKYIFVLFSVVVLMGNIYIYGT